MLLLYTYLTLHQTWCIYYPSIFTVYLLISLTYIGSLTIILYGFIKNKVFIVVSNSIHCMRIRTHHKRFWLVYRRFRNGNPLYPIYSGSYEYPGLPTDHSSSFFPVGSRHQESGPCEKTSCHFPLSHPLTHFCIRDVFIEIWSFRLLKEVGVTYFLFLSTLMNVTVIVTYQNHFGIHL